MKEKSNNSVLISRITSMCSNRQISVNKMLLESGAGTSTVDNLKKGSSPTTYLGRTDNPSMTTITITSSPSITESGNQNNAGNIEHITINEESNMVF